MKICILIFFLLPTKRIYCQIITNEYYDIEENKKVNETTGHIYMDATFRTNFLCLALCNSNTSCFTAVFQKQNGVCILYSKVFPTTELANSIGSYIYKKKCSQAQVSVTEILPTPTNNSATSKSTNTICHSSTDTTTTTSSSNFTLDDFCLNKSWLS